MLDAAGGVAADVLARLRLILAGDTGTAAYYGSDAPFPDSGTWDIVDMSETLIACDVWNPDNWLVAYFSPSAYQVAVPLVAAYGDYLLRIRGTQCSSYKFTVGT